MRDARVVRRLIAAHDPDLSSAWKRALGIGLHMATTLSDMEARVADLRRHTEAVRAPLKELGDLLMGALRDGVPLDKPAVMRIVKQVARIGQQVADFDERNYVERELEALVQKVNAYRGPVAT